jgi:hypothetical protein
MSIPMPHDLLVAESPGKTGTKVTSCSGAALARFLELRGRRVIHASGATWYTVPGRFLMSLPYEQMLDPDPKELMAAVRETGCLGARFPSVTWTGLPSGHYVLRQGSYDLHSLHVKHRPRVRHGKEKFQVRPASKSQLITQGRELNLSTMERQGRYDPEFGDPRRWQTFVEAAFACHEIAFPAVFSGSRMAAYMVTCREQRWLQILHQMSRHEDLPDYPNHLLTYAVSEQAAADPSIDAVCYGYVPLFAADGLHEYKVRFGYELIPHQSAILLHPALKPVLDNPIACGAIRLARRFLRSDQGLEVIQSILEGARCSRRE